MFYGVKEKWNQNCIGFPFLFKRNQIFFKSTMFIVFIGTGREEGTLEYWISTWVNCHRTGFHEKYEFFHGSRVLVTGSNLETSAINISLAYKKHLHVSDWIFQTRVIITLLMIFLLYLYYNYIFQLKIFIILLSAWNGSMVNTISHKTYICVTIKQIIPI